MSFFIGPPSPPRDETVLLGGNTGLDRLKSPGCGRSLRTRYLLLNKYQSLNTNSNERAVQIKSTVRTFIFFEFLNANWHLILRKSVKSVRSHPPLWYVDFTYFASNANQTSLKSESRVMRAVMALPTAIASM